jgi:WD40 repeat protein
MEIVDVPTWGNGVQLQGLCEFRPFVEVDPAPPCQSFPETPFAMKPWRGAWSPDGRLIALTSDEPEAFVAVWDTASGALIANSATHQLIDPAAPDAPFSGAFDVTFLPDSSQLLISARRSVDDWYVRGISTETWTVEATREVEGSMLRLAFVGFSDDAATLYVVSGWTNAFGGGGSLHAFDAGTLEDVRPAVSGLHDGELWAIAISPDGSSIATGATDGTLRVWDAATGRLTHELSFAPQHVVTVGFVDENRLAAGLVDATVHLVAIDPDQLLDIVADSLTRGYTDAECERFNFETCPTLEEMRGD